MFSGDIELNPGPVLNSVRCYQLKLRCYQLHIRVCNNTVNKIFTNICKC